MKNTWRKPAWLLATSTVVLALAHVPSVSQADPPAVSDRLNPIARGGVPDDGIRPMSQVITLPSSRGVAPLALDPAKRMTKIKEAIKLAGIPAIPASQTLDTRITPASPRQPSGEITYAGTAVWSIGGSGEPDGSIALVRATGTMVAMSGVDLKLATETGKLYLMDCRLGVANGNIKLMIVRNGSAQPLPLEDGHAIHAFQAKGPKTDVSIKWIPSGSSDNYFGAFYGCEVGKANVN